MMYLAELNIARLKAPIDHPDTAGFANNLDRINALAERMDGFVWRHVDDTGNATNTRIGDDPNLIVNMSVWRNVQALETFVWDTVHRQFYLRRDEWFKSFGGMSFVMWWVPQEHRPTIAEAAERLNALQANGSSDQAFDWAYLKEATRWRDMRCTPLSAE